MINRRFLFITGTDTGVGKTMVTGLLGRYLLEKDFSVATQKWVQTGSGNSNDVAEHLRLMGRKRTSLTSNMVPYSFVYPSSPHLAAKMDGKLVEFSGIKKAMDRLAERHDIVLIEGAGGLMVPLNEEETTLDLIVKLRLPVLLVAENRLGAINHTVLTLEAMNTRGVIVAGVIFNRLSAKGDDIILSDNRRVIERMTGADILGELLYSPDPATLQERFRPIGKKLESFFE